MRKTIAPAIFQSKNQTREWLDLSQTASVEVTSEDPNYPIEEAFASQGARGWRAAVAGDQKIRVLFDKPTFVRQIQLRFSETAEERTQEFTLRWYNTEAKATVIVRQQWNFSPAGSTVEFEDYHVNLEAVCTLELEVRPALNGRSIATLDYWRVG